MRLRQDERERLYVAHLGVAPWQVKICKLADIYDNLIDSKHLTPEQREGTRKRTRQYLDALGTRIPAEARPAYEMVERLFAEVLSTNAR